MDQRAKASVLPRVLIVGSTILYLLFFLPHCAVRTEPSRVWHLRDKMTVLVESLVDLPYLNGGEDIDGFDCSGFVYYVYDCFGIKIPRSAKEQSKMKSKIRFSKARPTDILVFNINRKWHTAIYDGSGFFIHAPKRGSLIRKEKLNDYWKKRLKTVIAVLD